MPVKKKAPAKKRVKKSDMAVPMMAQDKNVSVDKIANGYLVSTYTDKGTKKVFAEDQNQVAKYVKKLLG